jgi:hypothetical protein
MSNVFQYTPLTYFQIPEAVIDSGKWASLKLSAKDLYTLLLYTAQKTSSEFVSLTAADAVRVGLSVNAVKNGRDALVAAGLISAERTGDGYSYELLDPSTGVSLKRIADLSKIDPEIVGQYFMEHLGDREHRETVDGLQCNCVFHEEKKGRDKSLSITFADGGAFHCHGCGIEGGIIDFETAVSEKTGEKINRDRAFSRVRTAHLSNMRRQAKRRAKEHAAARAML